MGTSQLSSGSNNRLQTKKWVFYTQLQTISVTAEGNSLRMPVKQFFAKYDQCDYIKSHDNLFSFDKYNFAVNLKSSNWIQLWILYYDQIEIAIQRIYSVSILYIDIFLLAKKKQKSLYYFRLAVGQPGYWIYL